jgi:uncharacterized protein (DUF305 family)
MSDPYLIGEHMLFRRLASTALSIALPVTLAIGLTACGTSSGAKVSAAKSTDTLATNASFNSGDVTFAQGMIPHHQQAVSMAEIALDPTRQAGPAVLDLATRIKGAQSPEIELMTSWLTAWNRPLAAETGMKGMEGMEGMETEGMMSGTEMNALAKATGSEFDKMWLTMMVRHHDGAVAMSKTVQANGKSADVKELAGKIIAAQMIEIAEMNKLV